MSFSSDIKEELSKVNNFNNKSILEAELLGYVLTGNITNNSNSIEYITENDFNIERLYKILFNLNIKYEPDIKGKFYLATIKKDSQVERIMKLKFNLSNELKKAIVRGSFLGSGSVTDPENQYYLKIIFEEKENAQYILDICENFNIKIKLLKSENKYHLYMKESEEISKFLALIGASRAVLSFEDVRVIKEMKNSVNRRVNCETSNLNKIVNASVNQINNIKLIQKSNKFDLLSDELKELAILRLQNPDISLKDIGLMLEKPIGKSGVNNRFKKIKEIAEGLKK